jgi:arabinose-5-phosphate isomerase
MTNERYSTGGTTGGDPHDEIAEAIERTLTVQSSTIDEMQNPRTVEEITAVARTIDGADGTVVLTGVGKSGDVGKKITATFNSIGVTSNFLHPVEALHGDLGIVSEDDVIVLISNSGNTDEMVELLKVLSAFDPTTVAITSSAESKLGTRTDHHIETGVSEEGSLVDQVPMASATATMVVGDCIANTLMCLQNFEEEDFGYLHPGGTIGKQLLLDVSDILYDNIPKTSPDDTLAETAVDMSRGEKGIAVIRDDDDRVLGILTDGDVRRLIETGTDFHEVVASDVMTEDPITIAPDASAIRALNVIEEHDVTQIVVTEEEGRFRGVVHFHDIMQEGLSN